MLIMARMQEQARVTRGMVLVARSVDLAGLTWGKAADAAGLDPGHFGEVMKGKPPGRETIAKLRDAFGTDANLWLEDASEEEQFEYERRLASMRERAHSGRQRERRPS